MKIELTIKTSYLPEWGIWEGLRELVQNGRDAEVELAAKLTVTRYKNKLYIENDGCILPHQALLLGHTTKADRSDTIGRFGEGLKLGILALVRKGIIVRIRSGGEVWTPYLAKSEKFDAEVLCFDISKGNVEKKRVRVEVEGIDEEAFGLLKDRFLFLTPPGKDEAVKTYSGTLLLGEKFKGKIFVKGIFVQVSPDLSYGYDITDASLDRDRKMVASWDLKWKTTSIWREASGARPDLLPSLYDLLASAKKDIEGMDSATAGYLDRSAQEAVAKKFRDLHGDEAVPVKSLAESTDIEHLGKRGVIVADQLAAVLATTLGTVETVKAALKEEVIKTYGRHEISDPEWASLTEAIALVGAVVPSCTLASVEVCDFRDPKILGQHKNGKSYISKAQLLDSEETLATLVHEVAHGAGGDGEHSHVATIEDIWKGIVRNLRKRPS